MARRLDYGQVGRKAKIAKQGSETVAPEVIEPDRHPRMSRAKLKARQYDAVSKKLAKSARDFYLEGEWQIVQPEKALLRGRKRRR